MKKLRFLMVIALALLSSGFSNKGIWIIDTESQLIIKGSSNINNFTCKTEYCTGTDTLQFEENSTAREMRFTRSRMTIPISSFDCGSKPISRDFRETLKEEAFPEMNINFISLQNLYFKNDSNIKGIVDITLAGVTARYTIRYKVTVNGDGTVLLQGNHAVNFSDFQLVAPRKLKGLIKVKEVLKVDFNLVLKEI